MENLNLCLTILATGFVVVFAVLILLIFIIKIYGTIVTKSLKAAQNRKEKKQKAINEAKRAQAAQEAAAVKAEEKPLPQKQPEAQGISPEVVAVIAAAVDATYGTGGARITGIKKSKTPNSRPAWGMAGVFENTRPF